MVTGIPPQIKLPDVMTEAVGCVAMVAVTVTGAPAHPVAVGMAVYVMTPGTAVLLSEILPVPALPLLPAHTKVEVATHEVSGILTGLPAQTVTLAACASGAGFIVMFLGDKPATEIPHASIIVGGGTLSVVLAPQKVGQPGMVSSIVSVPVLEQPPTEFPYVMLPAAHG